MAKRKVQKLQKVSNILDSYIKFKDMEDEEFRKTFGGTKDTIINSWLYLLYIDLKEHFESQPEEEEEEEETVDLEEKKKKKRQVRRRTKRSPTKVKETAESDDQSEENADQEQDSDEDIFGVNGENIKVES